MNITWSKPSLSRDFAFFAALIVFVLTIAALWVTYEAYIDHSQQMVHQMETEATRIDRAMILEIEHSSYLLQALGQQITHMNTDDLNGIAVLLRSFDTTATLHHVFSWIDANQNNVVSSNKGVHKPVDVSDRDFVKMAMAEPGKIQIGNPIQGRVSNKWALPVALGLTDSTGKYIGTILISMDIDTLTRNLRSAVKGSGISFTVYSRSLLPLNQTIAEEKMLPIDIYSQQLKTTDLTKYPSGVLSVASLFDKNSMYIYYEVSANYPYIIMLGFDNSASWAAMRELLIPRLIQILAMGIFMLALLWLVRSRIIKPISELATITGGIARGEPYRDPISSGGVNELYVLAQQIKKLSNYIDEIFRIEEENKNKNLMFRKGKEASDLSNKIKIEFLTAMSHDLRTPLNTIIGFSEIMKLQSYGTFENPQYLQCVKDINEAAHQLQYLTDDVMALSSAEAGMIELQEKHIDVRFMLSKCLRQVADRLGDNKLHIELKLPDTMPRLLMDEGRLKQIIINLILNAINQSAADSHVVIRAYTEQDKGGKETFCLAFSDSRASLAKTGRAEVSKTAKYSLSNLSIPLTKALVAMHQATLEIKNQPGKPYSTILRFPPERLIY